MFQSLYRLDSTCRRHFEAPLAAERGRYLRHCLAQGATHSTLRSTGSTLLRVALHMQKHDREGVDIARLQEIVGRDSTACAAVTIRNRINIARPWLRFLGWWRSPEIEIPFRGQLDRYVTWMRVERGFSPSTVLQWYSRVAMFLRWCGQTHRQLKTLQPSDIDEYFVTVGAKRWSRVSARHMACALRIFLRHAASHNECDARLPETIRGPRVYEQESLPFAPGWSDVRRILAYGATETTGDVRDRAILMLLAIYGLRRGEVASLRLDQIDWGGRQLRVFRLKRREPQIYPLLPSVAEALACYIDTARPKVTHREVFIRLKAPHRGITAGCIYDLVSRRFKALGIEVVHRGPHALRHACAARLVAEGLSLKEIGDHLGHRSTSATRTYAKVDLASLREVGDFDLGDLQ